MAHIVGCVKARELTTCKQGANQHAHIVMRKSVVSTEKTGGESTQTPEANPGSEAPEMSIAAMKRIAAMTDVTKSYFVALPDTEAEEFLKKDAADQDKIAADAKKAKEDTEAAEKAKAAGQTETEAELRKSIETANTTNAELTKRLDALTQERDLEKRADAEFAGFPGGTVAAVAKLKSIASLSEADRKGIEDMMKQQIIFAKSGMTNVAVQPTPEEFAKTAPARAEAQERAKALQTKSPELTETQALSKVLTTDPALAGRCYAEEQADQSQAAAA